MSRPIVMTDEMKEKAREEFAALLDNLKMSDRKLNYSCGFSCDNCKAAVLLTHEAYRKTVALLTEFSDEVAWHGTVTRSGESEFIIEDIFVYPQEVTGSTVVTDQDEYTKWLYALGDEVFEKLRMQGHSHVNMGVLPSGVDDRHRRQILEQLEPDMFYIFMVWNKSLSVHTLIYDMARNVLYEDKDIDVRLIYDDGIGKFLTDAKEKVQKRNVKKSVKTVARKNSKKQEQAEFDTGLCEYFPYSRYKNPQFDEFDLGGEAWRI